MKKHIMAMMLMPMMMAATAIAADPVVSDVRAKQRYPWNGLVDITCNVSGVDVAGTWRFSVEAIMPDSGNTRKVSEFWVLKNGVRSTDRKVQANGSYKLLWDAQADLGEVFYSNMVMRVTVVDVHGKVQLWKDGPYWAETNIGADEPWEYGYYFWWGDTVGYKRENNKWVAIDGSSSNFSFDGANIPTYENYKSIATLKSEGWITADEILAPEHDAAHVQWGGSWRMPTQRELDDLSNNCDWIWTTKNDVNGYVVRGRGDYASSSIFLPCAGEGYRTLFGVDGSDGWYWSSVPLPYYGFSCSLGFNSSWHSAGNELGRIYGQSVRPVQGPIK